MSAQPWRSVGPTVYQLTDDGKENIWAAHVSGSKTSFEDDCKTAQKMAAAPDMYEALKAVVDVLQEWHNDLPEHIGDKEPAVMSKARAALAKARGQ